MPSESRMTVSVVVPVRNGGRFLDDCVGFLSAQTFTDFETIYVVDANSTDDTAKKIG